MKIFVDKSEIINVLRNEIENLNKQLREHTRKSIVDQSIINNHEYEMDTMKENIRVFEAEKSDRG
jgi:hypothetical protein